MDSTKFYTKKEKSPFSSMININVNPLAEKPSLFSKVKSFVNANTDAVFLFVTLAILFSGVLIFANQYASTQKFARGLYVDQNLTRFLDGKITLNDIEILQKLGDSKGYIQDWKYYQKHKSE